MTGRRRRALVERLAGYRSAIEVGIGDRTAIAATLARRGTAIVATDVVERSVPPTVRFVRDDVTAPEIAYDAAVVYALNCPPELHRPLVAAARAGRCRSDVVFTTLGGDPPAVPATPEPIDGTVLYRYRPTPTEHGTTPTARQRRDAA